MKILTIRVDEETPTMTSGADTLADRDEGGNPDPGVSKKDQKKKQNDSAGVQKRKALEEAGLRQGVDADLYYYVKNPSRSDVQKAIKQIKSKEYVGNFVSIDKNGKGNVHMVVWKDDRTKAGWRLQGDVLLDAARKHKFELYDNSAEGMIVAKKNVLHIQTDPDYSDEDYNDDDQYTTTATELEPILKNNSKVKAMGIKLSVGMFNPLREAVDDNGTFAGKRVFDVESDTYHNCRQCKGRYERYKKYLDPENPEHNIIKQFALKNRHVIIRDKSTGAMTYLKVPYESPNQLPEAAKIQVRVNKPKQTIPSNRPPTDASAGMKFFEFATYYHLMKANFVDKKQHWKFSNITHAVAMAKIDYVESGKQISPTMRKQLDAIAKTYGESQKDVSLFAKDTPAQKKLLAKARKVALTEETSLLFEKMAATANLDALEGAVDQYRNLIKQASKKGFFSKKPHRDQFSELARTIDDLRRKVSREVKFLEPLSLAKSAEKDFKKIENDIFKLFKLGIKYHLPEAKYPEPRKDMPPVVFEKVVRGGKKMYKAITTHKDGSFNVARGTVVDSKTIQDMKKAGIPVTII